MATNGKARFYFAYALLPMLAAASSASATTELTQAQLASLVQSTANDTDMVLLSYLTAQPSTLSYLYSATATDATWGSWSGALTGDFGGSPFSLAYNNGVTTGYPPGTVSWTTLGTLGVGAVSGGGSGTVSYPTPSTFDLSFDDSLSYGGVSATADFSVSGTVLGGDAFMLGSPGDPEADATGTITLSDPTVIIIAGKYSWIVSPKFVYDDTVIRIGRNIRLLRIKSLGFLDDEDMGVGNRGTLAPEPSTWAMLMIGFAGLGYTA